jgi:hypothetical protein
LRLRASRTRLDITMSSCGPVRWQATDGGARKSWMVIESFGFGVWGFGFGVGDDGPGGQLETPNSKLETKLFHPLDLIPQLRRFLEVLLRDGLVQPLLELLDLLRLGAGLLERGGHLAGVFDALVH